MDTKLKYDVVEAGSIEELIGMVNSKIEGGWELLGGAAPSLSVSEGYENFVILQAITKEVGVVPDSPATDEYLAAMDAITNCIGILPKCTFRCDTETKEIVCTFMGRNNRVIRLSYDTINDSKPHQLRDIMRTIMQDEGLSIEIT